MLLSNRILAFWILVGMVVGSSSAAPSPPYDNPPAIEPPYYRVRYEASERPGELIFPVSYTVWIPPTADTLRGVIVHQHGCGEGSCKSGQTGAFDLHWQALARKHHCALLAPAYEQPQQVLPVRESGPVGKLGLVVSIGSVPNRGKVTCASSQSVDVRLQKGF
ncbi:hypothetical protein [Roseiconus nitratireducens]|uniref:hypothetical protein n=1 Tax=Roseiconus nitratireducens TaxID=2605748 RepID=UPI00191C4C90|nr:hypothetical protein [Roseiconus nitratireducens]